MNQNAVNVIENLALRIAEKHGGRISPNHLMPFLPVSLELIDECLENMADQTEIYRERKDELVKYEFSAYLDKPEGKPTLDEVDGCIGCDSSLMSENHAFLCEKCFRILQDELSGLAERTGWPAQAVYEHEILYIASKLPAGATAESLASRSRYTLKGMKSRLARMVAHGYAKTKLDEKKGGLLYYFPEIDYKESLYRRNSAVISRYPASVMEEMQTKISQIFVALTGLLILLLVIGFLGIPFPFRVLGFIVSAPIVALFIWRHKKKPEEVK